VEEFLALHKYLAFFCDSPQRSIFFLFLEVLQRALKVQGDAGADPQPPPQPM
jgi:hypothetical protein